MDNRGAGHHPRTMIGNPSTYNPGQRRPTIPTDEAGYEAYLQQALPSSTVPSAAHSHRTLEQHPSASNLEGAGFGVFEPQAGAGRSYSSFAPLIDGRQQQQQVPTQQVPGEFVPGAGGGTAGYYRAQRQPQRELTRSSTNHSGYSDSSANLSPVRSNGHNPSAYTSPTGPGPMAYYPTNTFEYSSGSDPFASSDQYTSPSAMSPDKYISSPEQIQMHHPNPPHQQGIFPLTGGAQPFVSPTGYAAQAANPFGNASPTRNVSSPTHAVGGGYTNTNANAGWQSVDNTAAIAPGAHDTTNRVASRPGPTGSSGSHSSGGGGGGGSAGPYAASHSSGGGGAYSSQSGSNPRFGVPQRQGAPIGRSHSMSGTRHAHSQSASGHLAPPTGARRPAKRQHQEEEEDESDGEDDVVTTGRPQRGGAKRLPGACSHCKRLKMKCVFENGHDVCQRCQHTNKVCIVEGRKPRQGPNKRELMMREIASKDQLIDSLLRQIHNPAMRTPINWPSSVPVPQQSATSPERPPDKDVLAWIESIRQNRPPTPTGSIDASNPQPRAQSEPLPAPHDPEDDALSLGESASHVKDKEDRPRTPAELRQDSAELPDTLHSIPPPAAPVGLIAKLSLTVNRDKRGSDAGMTGDAEEEDKWVGIGNTTYFEAGPSADPELRRIIIERQMPPEILTHGIIKPAEVETLFKIFFEQLNPFVAILDPNMHTPAFVFGRCPFLFTAICAISSRYYSKRPELYTIAMHFAKQSAATALIDGWKSVELVQAYILMSVYPVPARRWEEDRTWLYLGLAIRMATDLNLHLPWQGKATGEAHEREILNRTRTWLICFNLDRSGATQFGRPPTIREDYIVRKSHDWYKRSKFNLSLDVHLTGYTTLLRIVARFLAQVYSDSNAPTALNRNLDFLMHCTASDNELIEYERQTKEQFDKESDHNDPACEYRCNLLPFLSNYSRLVIYSFGHQQAFQRGLEQGKIFFDKCYKAASEVVRIATDILAPSGRLKYAPDGHFVFLSFAAAFLLKMLRPQFAAACEPAQSARIIQLVTRLTEVLASNEVSIDDRHSPRLYSRFLNGLIAKHATQGGMVLAKAGASGTGGGAGAAGAGGTGGAGGKGAPGRNAAPNQTVNNGASSGAGPSKSAAATDAGMMHESPPSAPVPLAPENGDKLSSLPPPRMRSPPIVIRPPTIDQGMHDAGRAIDLTSPRSHSSHGRSPSNEQPNPNIMGGYVTVEPGGDTMSSLASTTQGETTITDASDANMEFDENHDMLAAMYALQDPTWWNSSLLPGFNANFADDGSNSSNEMRSLYAGQGMMPTGAVNGETGFNMQGNNMPNLFAPGLDFTQGMGMDHNAMAMDQMMAGYGYQ